jgi:hypothetical protein
LEELEPVLKPVSLQGPASLDQKFQSITELPEDKWLKFV